MIVEKVGPTDLVLECSPEAQGVEAGIPLAEALSRCPEAFVLPSDRRFYDDVCDQMADRLAMRCPWVEKAALGCLFAGLEGMAPSYCGEARLIASLLQVVPPGFRPSGGSGFSPVGSLGIGGRFPSGPGGQGAPCHAGVSRQQLHRASAPIPAEPGPTAPGGRLHPPTTGGDAPRHRADPLGRGGSPRLGIGPSHGFRTDAGIPESGLTWRG